MRPMAIWFAALSIFMVSAGEGRAEDGSNRWYPEREDAMAAVDDALARARDEGRLALIALGADWCHDSRALASRLQQSPLREVIGAHYVTVLVNVGYYQFGRDVVRRFGPPIYYATPTVLIVDPHTERLVNPDDRHQWGHADTLSMDESVAYFQKHANGQPPDSEASMSAALAAHDTRIAGYESALAERVAAGYARVGPELAAHKAGNTPGDFETHWAELSEFRNGVPARIEALRAEARRRVAAGERDFELVYPELPPRFWEMP